MTDSPKANDQPIDDEWPTEYIPEQPPVLGQCQIGNFTQLADGPQTINVPKRIGRWSKPCGPIEQKPLVPLAAQPQICPVGVVLLGNQGRAALGPLPKSFAVNPRQESCSETTPIPFNNKPSHFPGLLHRSGFFSVGRSTEEHRSVDVKSQGRYNLQVEGPPLSMHDKAVWEAVIDIAKERGHDLSEPLCTSLSEIARQCGAAFTGSRTTNAVRDGLERLCRVHLECTIEQAGRVGGQLLIGVEIGSQGATVSFDPELMAALLGSDFNFLIDTKRRRLLNGYLAQWMHDFLSTHAQSKPLTLKYVRELCGYASDPKRFPAALTDAMEELKSKAPGLVAAFSINKTTRTGDFWTLQITRGPDLPKFVGFKPKAPNQETRPRNRRGGVVL